ncbi:MAG: cytochrome c peroxidase, partial [Rhodobacterales bacterium]
MSHCIHYSNKFFSVCITRASRGQQLNVSILKFSSFHQVTRFFNACKARWSYKNKKYKYISHIICLSCLSSMVQAQVLPQTLTEKDFLNFSNEQTKLGQLLFYDKILSGNSNISCATCHHPDHGTGDGLSLGIGEGGVGLGPKRIIGDDVIKKRIPRNSSALWNLGAKKINVLF